MINRRIIIYLNLPRVQSKHRHLKSHVSILLYLKIFLSVCITKISSKGFNYTIKTQIRLSKKLLSLFLFLVKFCFLNGLLEIWCKAKEKKYLEKTSLLIEQDQN